VTEIALGGATADAKDVNLETRIWLVLGSNQITVTIRIDPASLPPDP
jgi:uncharacterized ferredoxin-like protein